MTRDPHDETTRGAGRMCPAGRPPDISAGGVYAWQLPHDETAPALARSLIASTMTTLGLNRDLINDGRLAHRLGESLPLLLARPIRAVRTAPATRPPRSGRLADRAGADVLLSALIALIAPEGRHRTATNPPNSLLPWRPSDCSTYQEPQ